MGLRQDPPGLTARKARGHPVAGIGLTVSLFIAELAFEVGPLQDVARLGVLGGSLMAATAGGLALRWTSRSAPVPDAPPWPARGTLFGW